MDNIAKFLVEDALILIPALYVFGLILKNTPRVPDWTIPWAVLVLGIVLGVAVVGSVLDGILQGVLVAGATVFVNQLVKQTKERE